MIQIEKYGMFELELAAVAEDMWVADCAHFSCGDQQFTTGIFKKDGHYAVRFMPQTEGEWNYRICIPGTKEDTNFVTEGRFRCVPNKGNNHGPVVTKGDMFCYKDGSVYYPFGTTCYAWTNQPKELQEQTVKTLAEAPFNKIRMCVFPKSMPYNNNEPEVFPFEKGEDGSWLVAKTVEAFWMNLDQRLMQLQELGIEADLIVFHPYDRWGFASMSQKDSLKYLTYVLYRYGAYRNLWWSLANEYETVYQKTLADWDEYGELLQEKDIYHHLISVHDIMTVYPDRPWLTHCSIQSNQFDKIKIYKEQHGGKPVMMDEFGYEGDLEYGWGNKSAFQEVDSFWHTIMRGGFATHGETFHREDEVLWWAKGGKLYGESPSRIGFLKDLLYSLPAGWHAANKELANPNLDGLSPEAIETAMFWKRLLDQADEEAKFGFWCGTTPMDIEGDTFTLQYCGDCRPRCVSFDMAKDKTYQVEVIDSMEMTREIVMDGVSGHFVVPLPSKKGMAVLITEK